MGLRKFLLALLALLVLVVGVVLMRTAAIGKQGVNNVPLAKLIEVDAAGPAANLAEAIRYKTPEPIQ